VIKGKSDIGSPKSLYSLTESRKYIFEISANVINKQVKIVRMFNDERFF